MHSKYSYEIEAEHQFLEQKSEKSRASTPQLADLDDQIEDKEQWSQADFVPAQGKRKHGDQNEGPTCPVCSVAVGGMSNQELNDHIDTCLNKEIIGVDAPQSGAAITDKEPKRSKADTGSRSSKRGKVDKGNKGGKGMLLQWLKRE